MPKRISSSDWTGPVEPSYKRGAFTYGAGQGSTSSDYQRLLIKQRPPFEFPPETGVTRRLAAWLFLSPAMLWLAWLIVGSASNDWLFRDNRNFLVIMGLGMMAIAAWQFQSRSIALVGLRNRLLAVMLGAVVACSGGYVWAGIDSHAQALASAHERTFELWATKGSRIHRTIVWHQRADGSNIEGFKRERPLPYSHTCALVQRLDGRYGFSWVRVLDRSRPPAAGQLSWPVRREDCFSEIPLSALPR